MRFIIFTIMLIYIFSMPARAEIFVVPEFQVSKAKSFQVKLADEATDGCWTNLREVREYAEEKIRNKGGFLISDPNAYAEYVFAIEVLGYRTGGLCVGSIVIELRTVLYRDNALSISVPHMAYVLMDNYVASGYPKLNNLVLNRVQEATNLLR